MNIYNHRKWFDSLTYKRNLANQPSETLAIFILLAISLMNLGSYQEFLV